MSKYCVVLTTFGSDKDAQKIINVVLENKLAACIQTMNISSHYLWKNEICRDAEILVLFKTTWDVYDVLETKIKEIHPYDTPEIIAIDIEKGFQGYLSWIDEVIR